VEILNQENLNDAGAAEIINKKYGLLSNTIITYLIDIINAK